MFSKYSVLRQDNRNPVAEELEDSESAHMIHNGDKILYQPRFKRTQLIISLHWIGHGVSILVIIALLFCGLPRRCNAPLASQRSPTVFTPADEFLGDLSHTEVFKNSFWEPSPYKGPPTEEVIARWDHLTNTSPVNLTAEEMIKLGHSLDSVQYPPEMGGGYLAHLEGVHQLHCLQALWEDHHYHKYPELFPGHGEKLRELPEIMEWHFEHCVDVIRNRLMCTADSQLVTFRWVEGVNGPYPYFNTNHVCHDYEALLDWDKMRQPNMELLKGYDWNPPADAVRLSRAP